MDVREEVRFLQSLEKVDQQSMFDVHTKESINLANIFGAQRLTSLKVNDLTTVGLKKVNFKSLRSLTFSYNCVFTSSLVFFCPSLQSRFSHIIRMFNFLITRVSFIGYLYPHGTMV